MCLYVYCDHRKMLTKFMSKIIYYISHYDNINKTLMTEIMSTVALMLNDVLQTIPLIYYKYVSIIKCF